MCLQLVGKLMSRLGGAGWEVVSGSWRGGAERRAAWNKTKGLKLELETVWRDRT